VRVRTGPDSNRGISPSSTLMALVDEELLRRSGDWKSVGMCEVEGGVKAEACIVVAFIRRGCFCGESVLQLFLMNMALTEIFSIKKKK
jgi:hypothetical protein